MLPQDVMNAGDVARYLNLGKNKVYELAKMGELASYRVGRKLRFTLEDVDAYVARARAQGAAPAVASAPPAPQEAAGEEGLSQAAAFGALDAGAFVCAGSHVAADVLASALNACGVPVALRSRASYTALVNLYAGDADMAVVSLYDQKSNSYNVPYVRSLAPGESVVVVRLVGCVRGFATAAGNPKRITTWGALLRQGVRLSNQVKGSSARVLLDEKLRAMDACASNVAGYGTHAPTAVQALGLVAGGLADVALCTQDEAQRVAGVDFTPLHAEWVDAVVAKSSRTRSLVRALKDLAADPALAAQLAAAGALDTSQLGTVVYES